jgi:hypothetical protein
MTENVGADLAATDDSVLQVIGRRVWVAKLAVRALTPFAEEDS